MCVVKNFLLTKLDGNTDGRDDHHELKHHSSTPGSSHKDRRVIDIANGYFSRNTDDRCRWKTRPGSFARNVAGETRNVGQVDALSGREACGTQMIAVLERLAKCLGRNTAIPAEKREAGRAIAARLVAHTCFTSLRARGGWSSRCCRSRRASGASGFPPTRRSTWWPRR